MSRRPDPHALRDALAAVADWLLDDTAEPPDRADVAAAVRLSARTLAADLPGAGVEVRIPPFVAVQCLSGPRHTRGNPPNVVETDPRTWLLLVRGLLSFAETVDAGMLRVSGARAGDIASWFPLATPDPAGPHPADQ